LIYQQASVEGWSVQFPAQQQTRLEHACAPEQAIRQLAAEQVTSPWQAPAPAQFTLPVSAATLVLPAHVAFPKQARSHERPEHARFAAQAPSPAHVIWFSPAVLSTSPPQAPGPLQTTLALAAPQPTFTAPAQDP
jgi:hypothetical protein